MSGLSRPLLLASATIASRAATAQSGLRDLPPGQLSFVTSDR
jgi:hypothetical protein